MASLKSNAPAMVGAREFDPEIKDMASYIHNYKIDSDLAVCEDLQIYQQAAIDSLITIAIV